ncbi:sulfite exporter TauE/SafE family protein [Neobacillus cucumis]|uniref:sulfite exporter TauE/SafE family protein n=1 Tax=Neobacillus cucumis TaxID=1740721 RepID=UPI002E23ED52|nr:sulfite exporter TauE/SafE family protein [Neobacillus cucumis]
MEQWILIISALIAVVLLSNIVQGITGFAGGIIAMPFVVLLIGLDTAKQVLNLLGILSAAYIVIKTYQHINWHEFFRIIFTMAIGLVTGLFLYNIVPLDWLLLILPFFIMFIGLRGFYLQKKGKPSSKDFGKTSSTLILLLAGIVHGLFVIGGPILVIYAAQKIKDKAEFRATLSMIWVILNSIIALETLWNGSFSTQSYHYTLLTIVPLLIGTLIGSVLHSKMSQNVFMMISYALLVISGVSLLF